MRVREGNYGCISNGGEQGTIIIVVKVKHAIINDQQVILEQE